MFSFGSLVSSDILLGTSGSINLAPDDERSKRRKLSFPLFVSS